MEEIVVIIISVQRHRQNATLLNLAAHWWSQARLRPPSYTLATDSCHMAGVIKLAMFGAKGGGEVFWVLAANPEVAVCVSDMPVTSEPPGDKPIVVLLLVCGGSTANVLFHCLYTVSF